MPKKVLIALPPAMLEQVDYAAQCEHRTRSDLIREALRRYLDNFRRNAPNAMPRFAVVPERPETTGLMLLLALLLSCMPAMAADEPREATLRGPILSFPAEGPVLGQLPDDWVKCETYAEKHPLVSYAPIKLYAGVRKVGKVTRTLWIGRTIKKMGSAASDAFVAFGEKTEKYHPGMQTLGYASSVLTPIGLGLWNGRR